MLEQNPVSASECASSPIAVSCKVEDALFNAGVASSQLRPLGRQEVLPIKAHIRGESRRRWINETHQ
jgi:hypothetical protein